MNQQYDDTNRWSLFLNDRRETETQANNTGTLDTFGVKWFINGWTPKPGSKLRQSGSVKLMDKQDPVAVAAMITQLQQWQQNNQQAPSGSGGQQFAASQQAQTPPSNQPQATPEFEDAIPFANPYKHKEYLI